MAYDGGDMIRVTATFTASGGGQVNPPSVYLQVMNPLGTVSTWNGWGASCENPATGVFYADILASIGGAWQYRWSGHVDNWAAVEGGFSVNQTVFIL